MCVTDDLTGETKSSAVRLQKSFFFFFQAPATFFLLSQGNKIKSFFDFIFIKKTVEFSEEGKMGSQTSKNEDKHIRMVIMGPPGMLFSLICDGV